MGNLIISIHENNAQWKKEQMFNKVSVIDQRGNINMIQKNKKSFIANKIAQILLDKLLDDRNFN